MKIIQIGKYPTDYSIIKGGVEASIYGIVKELAKRNEVTVISFPQKNVAQDYSVKDDDGTIVHYLTNSFKFQILGIFRLKTIISIMDKMKAEIVHVHGSSVLSLALILYCTFTKKELVFTEHGIIHIEEWKRFQQNKSIKAFLKLIGYSVVELLCLNLSKKIIVDTVYVKKQLRNITLRNLNVIPQGINSIFYTLLDIPDKMELLSIGSISPRKGYEYSIEAISLVQKEFPNIHYRIVGVIQADNIPYLERLKKRIQVLHLEDNVCIETNATFDYILRLMEKANVFVLHSLEESQGIAFCEAMAAGKPVVATHTGGIPFVVENGINGKLSEVGDVDAFARNIMDFLKGDAFRSSVSTQNRIASMRYSWEKIANEVVTLYTK
jgi:glycosyltransferase involved in cell wall biosynthesis